MTSSITKRLSSTEELIIGNFRNLKPKVSIPYAWANRLNANRLLGVRIDKSFHEIDIDKAMQKTELTVGSGVSERRYNVEVVVSGNAKRVSLTNVDSSSEIKV
jgi:DNA-binding Xre family transcriptional regulator